MHAQLVLSHWLALQCVHHVLLALLALAHAYSALLGQPQ
jgi:hypothetical protein